MVLIILQDSPVMEFSCVKCKGQQMSECTIQIVVYWLNIRSIQYDEEKNAKLNIYIFLVFYFTLLNVEIKCLSHSNQSVQF